MSCMCFLLILFFFLSFYKKNYYFLDRLTSERCLEIAVEITSEFLNKAVKRVMVGGQRLRMAKASK